MYESVKTRTHKNDEIKIPIRELYLYPCRGVPGAKVDSVQLGEHGIRYDRIFIIINDDAKQHYITSSNSPEVSTLS